MTDFILIPGNTPPNGAQLKMIETADGATLRAGFFPVENARGGVVLLNGRCEFIEKYFEVIEDLQTRGLSVATLDWRGQGLSSRLLPESDKGHILDFGAFKTDLYHFVEREVRPRFDGPLFLMTHSMGGLPALMLLAEGYDAFARAVLCAPMTRLFPGIRTRFFARTLAGAANYFGFSRHAIFGVKEYSLKFEGNALTSDRGRHERFQALQAAAPNACVFAPTYGWLAAAIKAMDAIHQPGALSDLKTPVLIVSAENDKLVYAPDHRQLAEDYAAIDCVTIKGALHEILMERDDIRDQYWKAFDEFLATALGAQC